MVWTLLVDRIGTPFSSFTHEHRNFVKKKKKQSNQTRFLLSSYHTFLPLGVREGEGFFCYEWNAAVGKALGYMTWEYSPKKGLERRVLNTLDRLVKGAVIIGLLAPSSYINTYSFLEAGGFCLFLFAFAHGPTTRSGPPAVL